MLFFFLYLGFFPCPSIFGHITHPSIRSPDVILDHILGWPSYEMFITDRMKSAHMALKHHVNQLADIYGGVVSSITPFSD